MMIFLTFLSIPINRTLTPQPGHFTLFDIFTYLFPVHNPECGLTFCILNERRNKNGNQIVATQPRTEE